MADMGLLPFQLPRQTLLMLQQSASPCGKLASPLGKGNRRWHLHRASVRVTSRTDPASVAGRWIALRRRSVIVRRPLLIAISQCRMAVARKLRSQVMCMPNTGGQNFPSASGFPQLRQQPRAFFITRLQTYKGHSASLRLHSHQPQMRLAPSSK
jgi:hypothetical protein